MPAGESPLTPAASWHPSRGAADGGGDGSGGTGMQRSRSTLARLTRSVSKLGGSRGSRGRADGAGPAAAEAAPQPPPPPPAAFRSGRELSAAGGGTGGSQANVATTTAARIKLFEQGTFNLEADLGSLSEKGVERLRADLAQLDAEVAAHLKAAVHEHYGEFVRATPGILRLEGEIQQLRTLLHSMGEVVEGLGEASAAALAPAGQRGGGGAAAADGDGAWGQAGDWAAWLECLDDADVAVAERRLPEALSLLRRLDKQLQRFAAAADRGDPAQQARLDGMREEVEARREQLAAIAEQAVLQPIATSADVRAAADLLARVAGPEAAHAAVLQAHAAKLKRRHAALLRPANSGGGDADGADYAAALGQRLALGLAAAADDVAVVFGREGGAAARPAALGATFLVWALHQTERACHLLRKHALLPFAAPAGLHACCRCVFAFAAHCAALEASHGLPLLPTLLRELWPPLEQVLARHMRKLGETLRRAVAAEVDALAAGEAAPPADLAAWEGLAAAFPSAEYLLDELEAAAGECARLASPRAGAALRRAAADLFQLYTASLAAALNAGLKAPGATAEAKERLAAAAEAAMELATLLLERFLPEALAPLSELCGEVCSAPAMAEQLVRMGVALGMAAVPLTPGGGAASGGGEAGVAAAAAAQDHTPALGWQQQRGAGAGGLESAVGGGRGRSSEESEAGRLATSDK